MLLLLLPLLALALGVGLLLVGAFLSERTRWGYGVMAAGIASSTYGFMLGLIAAVWATGPRIA